MGRKTIAFAFIFLAVALGAGAAALRQIPQTQPNQVVAIAPGVFFRHGDLEGNGHCNNGIVIFRDFALVIDGNFPSGAEACLADAKKITDKPVRFVFNTHHHGDHAYGNPVWVSNGVIPIAHQGVASEMARLEPQRWRQEMEKRPDVKSLGRDTPQPPIITYPDRMVIDDGTQRVELRSAVAAALSGGKSGKDLAGAVVLPAAVTGYVGNQFRDQVAKVEREMVGLEMPLELVRLGIEEGPSPTREDPDWKPPLKVV